MKKLINAVEDVVKEQLQGMAVAHPDMLKVYYEPNFVVRADAPVKGKVAVGNRSRTGPVELLVSPAEATFDFLGKPIAQLEKPQDDPEATESEPTTAAIPTVAVAPPTAAPAESEPENADPTPEPAAVRMSVAQAQSSMLRCLDAAVHGRPDGSVTIASTVTVVLGPVGRVDAVRFSPPLEPSLQSRCSSALFGQHLEGEGTATFSIQLTK